MNSRNQIRNVEHGPQFPSSGTCGINFPDACLRLTGVFGVLQRFIKSCSFWIGCDISGPKLAN